VKLVVGLGNPGTRYADTRHNVGWMVLDRLADRAGISGRGRERDSARSVRGHLGDVDLVLLKPLTFMNESGIAVRKALARDHVPLEDMLVVVDDFALPFGRLRVRPDGTHGGHNGLRSIVAELETQRFARLRVGIGEPQRHAIDHVLSRFSADERRLLPELLDAAADAVETWARQGAATAANQWNGWALAGTQAAGPGAGVARGAGAQGAGAQGAGAAAAGAGDGAGPEPAADGAAQARAAADAPAGPGGIRRTPTGWRRLLSHDEPARGDGPGTSRRDH
jgi:PTH1 family peptidyl-tRNA hydrolase